MSLHHRTTMQYLSSALRAPPFVQSHCILLGSSQESLGSGISRVGIVGTFLPAGVGQKAR